MIGYKPPKVRIFDSNINLIGEILGYTSLVYTRRWQTASQVDIEIPINAPGTNSLQIGNIIILDNDMHRSAIITSIQSSINNRHVINIIGYSPDILCSERLTVPPTDSLNMGYDNVPLVITPGQFGEPVSAETIIKEYAYRHLKRDTDRNISNLVISPDIQRGKTARWSTRFETLSDVLQKVCEYASIGYEIYTDYINKQFILDVIVGNDHTTLTDIVIFTTKHRNLRSMVYLKSLEGYKNVAYVAGSGEDENRLIQTVYEGVEPIGTNRREVFVDSGQMTIADGLIDEGNRALAQYPQKETLNAEIVNTGLFQYKRDWDLGDIVIVESPEIGVSMNTHIVEITERYDQQEVEIIPRFGTPSEKFKQIIERLSNKNKVR